MEQESCIGRLITGLAGPTWSMFTTPHSALTAHNCVKLHYSAYSLPQEEEGRKRGPRQEICISQSLCIDTREWEWIAIGGFWPSNFSTLKAWQITTKEDLCSLVPPTTSDESPEYVVREIGVSQIIFTAGHRILQPTLLLTDPEPGFPICSSLAQVSSANKRLGTLTVNTTVTSCSSRWLRGCLSDRGKKICSHLPLPPSVWSRLTAPVHGKVLGKSSLATSVASRAGISVLAFRSSLSWQCTFITFCCWDSESMQSSLPFSTTWQIGQNEPSQQQRIPFPVFNIPLKKFPVDREAKRCLILDQGVCKDIKKKCYLLIAPV